MSCGVGHRHGLDVAWLWVWCRPVATGPIEPLAWEHPYATDVTLKKQKKRKKKETNFIASRFVFLVTKQDILVVQKLAFVESTPCPSTLN